jgi:cardiolipin synthase
MDSGMPGTGIHPRSHELTLPQWRARPWRQRATDWLSSPLSAQL